MSGIPNAEAFRSLLLDRVQELQHSYNSVPVFVRHICGGLGVAIKRSSAVEQGKAYLNWDRANQVKPTIVLPESGNLVWDRFCAAHELAHFFLISQFDWVPSSKSAYWETEELCDEFARTLLIPAGLLSEVRMEQSDFLLIQQTRHLSRTAKVPWSQFAIALSRSSPSILLFKGSIHPDGTHMTLKSSSLPGYQGRLSKIGRGSPVLTRLKQAAGQSREQGSEIFFQAETSEFSGSRIGELLTDLQIPSVGVMVEPTRQEFFLAARQDNSTEPSSTP